MQKSDFFVGGTCLSNLYASGRFSGSEHGVPVSIPPQLNDARLPPTHR